jgi:hypothetical protein
MSVLDMPVGPAGAGERPAPLAPRPRPRNDDRPSPDMVGPLLHEHERLRRTNDGVGVQVADGAARRAAETLIRRRMELERYAPQMRNASP